MIVAIEDELGASGKLHFVGAASAGLRLRVRTRPEVFRRKRPQTRRLLGSRGRSSLDVGLWGGRLEAQGRASACAGGG